MNDKLIERAEWLADKIMGNDYILEAADVLRKIAKELRSAQSGGAPAVVAAVVPFHTLSEDFEHFMAYSGNMPTDERLKMAYEHGNDRGMHYAVSPASTTDDARTLAMVCDLFSIGSNARDRNTVLMSVANAVRRSSCLSAIEYNFFTATQKDNYGDEMEICALRWGDDRDQYIERFGAALAERLATQLESPDAAPPAPQQVVKDAERYQWLREHSDSMSLSPALTVAKVTGWGLEGWSGDDLNSAIDAALQSTPQGATK